MNNPLHYKPHPLCAEAMRHVMEDVALRPDDWQEEVRRGKMFGVLVAELQDTRELVTLRAYSGQILGRSDWEGYVPAVFDYLQPDGYFKKEEQRIVNINNEIEVLLSSSELADARSALETEKTKGEREIEEYRQVVLASRNALKTERNAPKETDADGAGEEQNGRLEKIAVIQFQKAELRRMKKRVAEAVLAREQAVNAITDRIDTLKTERRQRSDALQRWLFSQFVMLNGNGERCNLLEIFRQWADKHGSKCNIPPAGSGECCAPKLLQYAYSQGLKPIAMAEFWYGESPKGILRQHAHYYPACQSKCAPIMEWMLQGVDVDDNELTQQDDTTTLAVLYEDERIIAVDKPSGMLSVPGKSSRRSAYDILCDMRPECEHLMMAHRLDMDTSGILVAAKDLDTYRTLQRAFANHKDVRKVYYALVENLHKGVRHFCVNSVINLPLSPDYLNRPMQRVDYENGKESVTRWESLGERVVIINGEERYCTLLRLEPVTGRTHQLRVHCAHPDGLDAPIVGDNLYGTPADRLYLHAAELYLGDLVIKSSIPWG